MKYEGFIGPAYEAASKNVDCQQCVNLYPEITESGRGKEGEVAALVPTPGLKFLMTLGTGPIRLVHYDFPPIDSNNPSFRIFVVSGEEVYKLEYSLGAWTPTLLGTLETSSGYVSAESNHNSLGQTVFADGLNLYLYKKVSEPSVAETFDKFENLDLYQPEKPTKVLFLNQRFIIITNTQYFWSDVSSAVIDPLSFDTPERDLDSLSTGITLQSDLYLLGTRSTQVLADTGDANLPFQNVSGGYLEIGNLAPFSLDKINNTAFWLGRDAKGQGIVYAASGLSPQRISTHAIERAIRSYAHPENAYGFCYQSNGHAFYVLNFDEATWVYDGNTRLWHERCYTNEGVLERHRANFHCFIPELNTHLLGDYETNELFYFDEEYRYDEISSGPVAITRLRAAPHLSGESKGFTADRFEVEMEMGVGLDGIGQGTDPKVMLQVSKDGGHTWSQERLANIGKIGETKTRAVWHQLGFFRDLVVRIKVTDPVKVVVTSANIKISGGNS